MEASPLAARLPKASKITRNCLKYHNFVHEFQESVALRCVTSQLIQSPLI
jgi:hypothetical protein